jgi:hypothetical protein
VVETPTRVEVVSIGFEALKRGRVKSPQLRHFPLDLSQRCVSAQLGSLTKYQGLYFSPHALVLIYLLSSPASMGVFGKRTVYPEYTELSCCKTLAPLFGDRLVAVAAIRARKCSGSARQVVI